MIINADALERQTVNWTVNEYLPRRPFVDGSHPSAIRPYLNLKNKYYFPQSMRLIGRTQPLIKLAQHNTISGSVNTVNDFGASPSYRVSDETVRQVSVAMLQRQQQQSFFQLAAK